MSRQQFAKLCVTAFAVVAAIVLIAPPTWADEARKTFNIPAQDLGAALREFARQSNREILFSSEVAQGRKSKGVKGDLTADAALTKLLAGTGLLVAKSANGTTLVTTPDAKEASATSGPPIAPRGATNDQHQNSQASEASSARTQLQEVIVTGSRIPLMAGQQQVQPVRAYTREMIQQSGQTSISDFLNTLPDASITFNEAGYQTFGGQTTVALHGLPVGTTVVLLNGRRVETSFYGFFDLSNIPAAAVERVDVLPVGGSAIYGSDALAGAVNVILRNKVEGFEFNLKGGRAAEYNEQDADFSWGHSRDNASISLIGSWQHRSELLQSERAFSSLTRVPSDQPNTGTLGDYCFPGNIYSLNGNPLPGLGSATQAGIPAGLTGTPTTQNFLATAGVLNGCNGIGLALIPRTDREGALLSAQYTLSPALELFTETLFAHESPNQRVSDFIFLPGGSFGLYTIGASNPFNPFGEPVGVSYRYPGIGEYNYHTQTLVRPLLGLRGSVASDWTYEVTAYHSEDRERIKFANADPVALQTALNSPDPVTALNPFSGGAPGSPQLLQSLSASADVSEFRYVNQLTGAQAWLRGPLFHLPAGALQTVVGAEYTHEAQHTDLGIAFGNPPFNLARTTGALFGEALIPLIGVGTVSGQGDRLALNIAARYDHSDDFGGKATWQSGLTWRPVATLLVRGGYATSYKAPQLQQIGGGVQGTFTQGGTDPFRGNEAFLVPATSGANPNLAPEIGHARDFGLVYTSRDSPSLAASLTQFDIAIQNYIGNPSGQTLVDNPALFPGAVTRSPATPQDQQMGFLGPITAIRELSYNFGELHVSGVDVDVSYVAHTSMGEFTPSLALANIYKWESALSPGSPPVSYVSQATITGPGFAPRWKGTAALGWKLGTLSASLTGRYVGRYRDYQDYVTNDNVLGNLWLTDATFHVDVGRNIVGGVPGASEAHFDIGVVNLFNKKPQFSNGVGFDPLQADLRGRFGYLQLSVSL